MIIILECPPRPSTSHKQDIRKSAKTTQDGPEQGPRREPRPALQPHSCASTEAAVALHSHLQGLGGTTSQQNNHLKDYTQTHTGQREALAPEDAECALPPHLDPARRRAEAAQRTPGPRRRAARFSSCWREEARLQQLPQLGGARSHLTTEAEAGPRRGRSISSPTGPTKAVHPSQKGRRLHTVTGATTSEATFLRNHHSTKPAGCACLPRLL